MATAAARVYARARGGQLAPHGRFGLALVALSWVVSWSHLRPWSDLTFFPLWLGYIVTIDALVRPRLGTSLLQIGLPRVLRLFGASAAFWWIFEVINLRLNNWHYLQPSPVGPLHFILLATLSFSTVLPAIFETATLLHVLLPGRERRDTQSALAAVPRWLSCFMASVGVVYLVLPLLFPGLFFGLVWAALFFIIDPVNALLGQPSLLAVTYRGRWRAIGVLALAGLICGFFWEMWNWHAMPKWIYTVPIIPQQRFFEMPLLGYSGYVPFALECFALYHLILRLAGARADEVAWLLDLTPLRRMPLPGIPADEQSAQSAC